MKLNTIFLHGAKLYKTILSSYQPPDKLASTFFRSKKYIGSKERKFLSEMLFFSLRIKGLSDFCLDNIKDSLDFKAIEKNYEAAILITSTILSSLREINSGIELFKILPPFMKIDRSNLHDNIAKVISEIFETDIESSKKFIKKIESVYYNLNEKAKEIIEKATLTSDETVLLSHRYSLPAWIWDSIRSRHGYSDSFMAAIAESMIKSAPLCLRVNLNMAPRERVMEILEKEGIPARESGISPAGVIIGERVKIDHLPVYKNGLADIQDIGSQVIGFSLGPVEGDTILDACAGAGGKSLHIASIQNNKGQITGTDIELMRLKELSKRAKRSGFDSIKTLLIKKNKKNIFPVDKYDKILVDAPCSGMGTIRRMPVQKWRLTEKLLERHASKQLMILDEYKDMLRPGGIMVYSTCSIMPQENQEVVQKFLSDNHDFEPDPLLPVFEKHQVSIPGLKNDDFMLNLYPHIHESDGFFLARLRKKE